MMKSIDDNEKICTANAVNGKESWFLTENGLYEVLMQSRKPIAKQFKKEVKEILKSVRKHRIYAMDNIIDQVLADPDFEIKLLLN